MIWLVKGTKIRSVIKNGEKIPPITLTEDVRLEKYNNGVAYFKIGEDKYDGVIGKPEVLNDKAYQNWKQIEIENLEKNRKLQELGYIE